MSLVKFKLPSIIRLPTILTSVLKEISLLTIVLPEINNVSLIRTLEELSKVTSP